MRNNLIEHRPVRLIRLPRIGYVGRRIIIANVCVTSVLICIDADILGS